MQLATTFTEALEAHGTPFSPALIVDPAAQMRKRGA